MFAKLLGILGILLVTALASGAEKLRPIRTWTSADGKFHVTAKLAEIQEEAVVLEKDDGSRLTVRREKLSRGDQNYVARQSAPAAASIATSEKPAPPNPKAAAPEGVTQREFTRLFLDFNSRLWREVYQRQGKRSPAWDADAVTFLDATTVAACYLSANPILGGRRPRPVAELRAMGEALRKAGCDDPLVFSRYLSTLPPKSFRDPEAQIKPAIDMLKALESQHYPPLQVAFAASEVRRACDLSPDEEKDVQKVLTDQLLAAISAKEYAGINREFVLFAVRNLANSLPTMRKVFFDKDLHGAMKPSISNEFLDCLRASKDSDPWLTEIILARNEIDTAEAMGMPDASQRSMGILPADPKEQWAAARRYLTEAWKLHPEYPEAAADMMIPAVESGDEADSLQLWFDRAVAAQFDYKFAYAAMRVKLAKARDVEALYAFGRKCLQTGRFDTMVPYQLLICLKDIAYINRSNAVWQREGVCDDLRKMFRGYIEDGHELDPALFYTDMACCAYLADHLDDAHQALEKAGDAPDLKTFQSFGIDVEPMIGRTYAMSGPLKSSFAALEKAESEGKTAQAAKLCREMLDKIDKTDKAWTYLRNRWAALDIEAQFAGGSWVKIQPDADLAGWKPARGDWSVDAQGGLVGRLDVRGLDPRDVRGMTLLCRAKIGSRFELRGHAEILEPKDKLTGFGAIIGYDYPGNYWECFFYADDPGIQGGNIATICCARHHNPHRRPMRVKPSDDFCAIVYDGQVSTRTGVPKEGEPVSYVLNLEHDPPTEATPFGVGATRGWFTDPPVVVRFTELKLRKLTAPPTTIKVPEPE